MYTDQTEKIDVYSMGNIFYALMEKAYPFEELSSKKAQKMIINGKRPPLNETFTNSSDPATIALIKAMEMSWVQEVEKRASAREVENFLDSTLIELGVNGKSAR